MRTFWEQFFSFLSDLIDDRTTVIIVVFTLTVLVLYLKPTTAILSFVEKAVVGLFSFAVGRAVGNNNKR